MFGPAGVGESGKGVGETVGCSVTVAVVVAIAVGEGANVDDAVGPCGGSTGVPRSVQAAKSSKHAAIKIRGIYLRTSLEFPMRCLVS